MSDVQFPTQPLSALTTAIRDGTHGTHRRVAEGVPLLSAKNITANGDIALDDTDDLISESEYLDLTRSFRLQPGDLLLTIVGSLGRRAIYSGQRITFQRSVAYIRPQEQKLSSRFAFHWMGHPAFSVELARRSNATAQAGLYLGELAKLAVPVPEIREQSAIAQILDTLDTAIHETEAIIAKLKAVKQGLLHDLLTRGVDANGELRPPQAEAPHLYKESPLGWIPKDWEALALEQVTDTPICYGIVQVLRFVPNGVPVLAIRDLHGDYTTGIHRTALRIDTAYPRSRVRPGDVLLSIKGTLGRVGVVPSHFTGNISRDIALIRPTPRVRSQYLAQMLQSTVGQRLLSLAQVGTTRGEISIAPLRRIVVPLPDVNEQQRIETSCESADGRLKQEALALQKLRFQKSGLMNDLLTGRVRVTPLLAPERHERSA